MTRRCTQYVVVEHVVGGPPIRHEVAAGEDLTDVGRVAYALTGLLGVDIAESCDHAKTLIARGRLDFDGEPPITIETAAP